jgi:hypothetical protein
MGQAPDWRNHLLASFLVAASSLVCTDGRSTSDEPPAAQVEVHTTQERLLTSIGPDTLSDSARITRLLIDPADDATFVLTFADQSVGISSGLAMIDNRSPVAQLVWPDSVTAVWWPASHQLAFTTERTSNARVVIDVHAADLLVVDSLTNPVPVPDPPPLSTTDSILRTRAVRYVDSIHAQTPGAAARRSAFVYSVDTYHASRDGRLLAFHVTARNSEGRASNPSWFLIGHEASTADSIDQVIGSADELPAQAAAWANDTTFYYVKGRTLWKADVHYSLPR